MATRIIFARRFALPAGTTPVARGSTRRRDCPERAPGVAVRRQGPCQNQRHDGSTAAKTHVPYQRVKERIALRQRTTTRTPSQALTPIGPLTLLHGQEVISINHARIAQRPATARPTHSCDEDHGCRDRGNANHPETPMAPASGDG
eukprot:6134668-Pyramimonas_sp.AAC.1